MHREISGGVAAIAVIIMRETSNAITEESSVFFGGQEIIGYAFCG